MLIFLFGSGAFCMGGGGGAGFGSCTGNKGRNVKLAVRLGEGVGVVLVVGDSTRGGETATVGAASVGWAGIWGGDTGRDLGVGGDVDGVMSDGSADVGVWLSRVSAEGGSRGRSCMGTASRYGRMSGSTTRDSSRFFHLDGVRDCACAKREMGKGCLDGPDDGG